MDDSIFRIKDAPVGRTEFRLAVALGATLITVAVVTTPFASVMLWHLPGYMTVFCTAMLVINMLLAGLLFSKGSIEQNGHAVHLASAYFYIALIFVPIILVFPGGLASEPLIGTKDSVVWLWMYWHTGFGIAIIRYAWYSRAIKISAAPPTTAAIVVAAIVLLLAFSAIWGIHDMPIVFSQEESFFSGNALIIPTLTLSSNVLALIAVLRLKARTPEQLWLTVGMIAACMDVWLTVYGGQRFSLGWYVAKLGSLLTSLFVLLSHFHGLTVLYQGISEANRLLLVLANKDGLTGLSNRRNFDAMLEEEWLRSRRNKQALSLLMIDVDNFKKYNDQYGHPVGDECLRQIARVIHGVAHRPGDLAARYGGEEFALILGNTSEAGAKEIATRILQDIRSMAIPHENNPPLNLVTVSIGISSVVASPKLSATELILIADSALYRAKAAGRNLALFDAYKTSSHPTMHPNKR